MVLGYYSGSDLMLINIRNQMWGICMFTAMNIILWFE